MRKRPPGRHTDCQPIARSLGAVCWLTGRMAPGSVHSEKALTGQDTEENDLLIVNAEVVIWKNMQPVKGVWHDGPDGEKAAHEQGV